MKLELANYSVTPKVVLSNTPTEITIKPRGAHAAFDGNASYNIRFIPMEQSIAPLPATNHPSVSVTPKNGALTFVHAFPGEQAHVMLITLNDSVVIELLIYSLLPDLYAKRPYKGDIHVHSHYSD